MSDTQAKHIWPTGVLLKDYSRLSVILEEEVLAVISPEDLHIPTPRPLLRRSRLKEISGITAVYYCDHPPPPTHGAKQAVSRDRSHLSGLGRQARVGREDRVPNVTP